MYAIVSLLDEPANQQVEAIWNKLERECGLAGIKITPYPHFSWQVADDYQLDPLRTSLREMAETSSPVKVLCAGLGIFTGPEPVIYIHVVKNEQMFLYHRALWEKTALLAIKPSLYYSPDTWVPHITLAHSDVDSEKLACALRDLAVEDLAWELTITNLALVCQIGDEIGQLKDRFDFPQLGETF